MPSTLTIPKCGNRLAEGGRTLVGATQATSGTDAMQFALIPRAAPLASLLTAERPCVAAGFAKPYLRFVQWTTCCWAVGIYGNRSPLKVDSIAMASEQNCLLRPWPLSPSDD